MGVISRLVSFGDLVLASESPGARSLPRDRPSKRHGDKRSQVLQHRELRSFEVIAYAFHFPLVSLNSVFGLRCVLFRWTTTDQLRERA